MSSVLTVQWDRGERIGFMPRDSGLVYPEPVMTVLWRPMTTATIIDFDPEVLVVPPGAGEPGEEPPPGDDPGAPGGPFGPPELLVTRRRSEHLFLSKGLAVDLRAPAPAKVKAVLTANLPSGGGEDEKLRRVRISDVVKEEIGTERERLRLRASAAGRRALKRTESLEAKLELVVRYADQAPVELTRRVKIVETR
jgi:hypothetical protein